MSELEIVKFVENQMKDLEMEELKELAFKFLISRKKTALRQSKHNKKIKRSLEECK